MTARILSSHLLATLAASLFGIVASTATEAAPLNAPSKPLAAVNTTSDLVTDVYFRRRAYRYYYPSYYGRPYYYGTRYYRPYRYQRLRYYRPYRRWHYYDDYYYGPAYGYGPRYSGFRLSVPFVDLYIR